MAYIPSETNESNKLWIITTAGFVTAVKKSKFIPRKKYVNDLRQVEKGSKEGTIKINIPPKCQIHISILPSKTKFDKETKSQQETKCWRKSKGSQIWSWWR